MLKIIHVAAECAPFLKAGGLADVVAGLSKELLHQGHQVEILLPKYGCLKEPFLSTLALSPYPLHVYFEGKAVYTRIWHSHYDNIPLTFLDPDPLYHFFAGNALYGNDNEGAAFAFFCRAALELLLQRKESVDIVHCHDWHTALLPLLYRELVARQGLQIRASIFTIHNLAYQGIFPPSLLEQVGLCRDFYSGIYQLQDPRRPSRINLLKGGIVHSTKVTTVSPSYSHEVFFAPGGCGLEEVLKTHAYKFTGIINGLDREYWNPDTDNNLLVHYSTEEGLEHFVAKKFCNKRLLQEKLHLARDDRPLVASITRLVHQKGIDLIERSLYTTLEKGGQWVLLGSSPDAQIQGHFEALARQWNSHPMVHFELTHNETLAHQIFAGADLLLVPSLFEPCGLTQLIAMRYGTLPIVRHTGGLKDTVFDLDYASLPWEQRNGFSFDNPDAASLEWALGRAFHRYFNDTFGWQDALFHAAQQDWGWGPSTHRYVALYQDALSQPGL